MRLAAAAIGDRHRQNSLPNPIDTDGVKTVLAGLARQGPAGAQKQAKGISRADLAAIQATACSPRGRHGGRIEGAGPGPDRYRAVCGDV